MIALGYLAQAGFGTNTVVDGLGCIPSVPASLAVNILPGSIYQQAPVDSVAYASLGIDAVDQVIKQGIILPITSLTLTPPAIAGQAINYLIQASVFELDTGSTVLSYFNSANPAVPFTGPGGSGTAQPTIRQCTISLVAKAGVAATAGSQVTPAPDAGFVGLWVVTVANGATALTSSQISQYPTAPFISVKLPQVPAYIQSGSWAWGVDSGTANQLIVTLTPTPAVITPSFEIRVKKVGASSTSAVTIIVNGGAPIAVVNTDGSALTSSTPMNNGYLARLVFDGTSFRWTNTPTSTAVGSLGASSGEGINVSGGGIVSLSYPSLSVEPVVANTDLWSFYSQADTHHRVLSWTQFLALIAANLPASFVGFRIFSTPGSFSYSPTALVRSALVFCTGGGGGGSAGTTLYNGTSGGGGSTAISLIPLVGVSSLGVVVGAAGTFGVAVGGNGGNGGQSSVGALLAAGGGTGGIAGGPGVQQPGAGGIASLGQLKLPGGTGGNQLTISAGVPGAWGGDGGASFWGGIGRGAYSQASAAGAAGLFGGGGGGGVFSGNGGKGGDGLAVFIEFV
jgi:hypothetical protein